MTKFIREQVDRYIEHIVEQGFDRVIGTSGTILSLGTVATAVDRGSVPQEVRNLRVPAKSLRRLRKTAVEMDLEERMHLPGLDPRRADLMVAGAILLDTLLKELGAEEITLCDLALREGVLLDYIHQHRKRHRAGRSLSGRPPPLGDRAGRAMRVGSRPLAAGGGDRADVVRLHEAHSRARRSRARMARVRGASCTTSATTSATRSIIATRTT